MLTRVVLVVSFYWLVGQRVMMLHTLGCALVADGGMKMMTERGQRYEYERADRCPCAGGAARLHHMGKGR